MMLSGAAIKQKNLVDNAHPQNFRNASYDLRVDRVITLAGEEVAEYILPPQGMIEVISAERVRLPDAIAGYALVKTSLCNQGILAINIGIIDPGYEGLISSTLINFGKSPFVVRKDDVFLRLTFHEYQPQPELSRVVVKDAEYVADKKDKVKKHFSERFLDIQKTAEEVVKPVTERMLEGWKKSLFVWVPLAAFGFALLSFFVNWGAAWSARWTFLDKDQLKAAVVGDLRSQQLKEFEERLRNLEEQLRPQRPAPSGKPLPSAETPSR